MSERKYAMTRLRKGDYLLPSNDRATLWRIATYTEDGSASDSDGTVIRGTFWMVYKYRRPIPQTDAERRRFDEDIASWDGFESEYSMCRSRREAIGWALAQPSCLACDGRAALHTAGCPVVGPPRVLTQTEIATAIRSLANLPDDLG